VAVGYDRAAGVVTWTVDGVEKFSVNNLGFRINRTHLLLDHGGTEQSFVPKQLSCGMGLFSLLDGHGAQNKGLVRLSSAPNFYYNPTVAAPTPEVFVDPNSVQSRRLFGQGAILTVHRPSAGTLPAQ
jgi:Family of unknown function (DUF6081)